MGTGTDLMGEGQSSRKREMPGDRDLLIVYFITVSALCFDLLIPIKNIGSRLKRREGRDREAEVAISRRAEEGRLGNCSLR